MKFTLQRCENPTFTSILVSRNRFFSEHRVRAGGGLIGSSIRLDVSYLSCSRLFADCVEPTSYSSANHRLILNRLWRGSVHIYHKGGQHQEIKDRKSTAVHEIPVQFFPTPPTIHQGSDIGQPRGSPAFVEASLGRFMYYTTAGSSAKVQGVHFTQIGHILGLNTT